MRVEDRVGNGSENGSPREWQDVISCLPPSFQELPKTCRSGVEEMVARAGSLADQFHHYPLTPADLAQVSKMVAQRTSQVARELSEWVYKSEYERCRSFGDVFARANQLLQEKTEKTGRKELAAALSNSFSRVAENRLNGNVSGGFLLRRYLEATRFFVGPSLSWATVGDQKVFEKNFFGMLLPFFGLGADSFTFGRYFQDETLTVSFAFKDGAAVSRKLLVASLSLRQGSGNGDE